MILDLPQGQVEIENVIDFLINDEIDGKYIKHRIAVWYQIDGVDYMQASIKQEYEWIANMTSSYIHPHHAEQAFKAYKEFIGWRDTCKC